MLSEDMHTAYKRLLVLSLLSVCLFVFGFSANPESVYAAPCVEECEDAWAMCLDDCPDDCSTTDANCSSCTQACNVQYWNCMSRAVVCHIGLSYNPRCQVGYEDHCPIINGRAECDHPTAHSGYYQICSTFGGRQCVACPDHEFCRGSGGQPPCF